MVMCQTRTVGAECAILAIRRVESCLLSLVSAMTHTAPSARTASHAARMDVVTQDKLDKDRFRRDMGGLVEAYQEVARRLGIINENEPPRSSGPVLVSSKDDKDGGSVH